MKYKLVTIVGNERIEGRAFDTIESACEAAKQHLVVSLENNFPARIEIVPVP